MSLFRILTCFTLLIIATACDPSGSSLSSSVVPAKDSLPSDLSPSDPSDPQENPLTEPLPLICSALDFTGVTWPEDFRAVDEYAFSVAMNITGSFEGHHGWTNLSNNFDGQGFSLGILNQNLGQGTLQPLLLAMRDQHRSVLEAALTPAMLNSLLKMLSQWERNQNFAPQALEMVPLTMDSKEYLEPGMVEGDFDKLYGFTGLQSRSNSASVRWAVQNVYNDSSGQTFKPAWRKALKEIAGHPAYVTLQIQAARFIHRRAQSYRIRLQWKQLRSYLFLFDIVVQNGSLSGVHFQDFEDWRGQHLHRTEEEQMLKMLEIRLEDVNPKWRNDVRARKTAIIKGSGFVHGEHRNLPVEYCYDPVQSYSLPE